MVPSDDAISGLREALRHSPDNLPLRQALGEMLMGLGRYEEAEAEYREALARAPGEIKLKVSLATAFYQQGKNSHALVIVEDLLKSPNPSGRALVLHAKLLLRAGDVERAVRQYKRGVEADAGAADGDFAARLGISGQPESAESQTPWQQSEVVNGKLRASHETPANDREGQIERPSVTFADVGGMDEVKEEIRMKIIHPMSHPELYKSYGKTVGGGILMYGPPGCGKTHLARATAGEIRANFMAIGINDVLDMWIGSSERNLHALFEQARRSRPCVLFFDEVDALAASRADMRASAGRHMINQFLSEMDGIGASNEGVLTLAATNAPWHVDAAFRRPGRFDRILFVPPPDAPARSAILRIQLKGKPLDSIDHDHVAKKTDSFSGADLKAVVELAVEAKLRDAMRTGQSAPLTTGDLTRAASSVQPSTRDWFATARNYAMYSNQGGTYDAILRYLKLK
jgi:transitional endoplasmic reticulum ATPase